MIRNILRSKSLVLLSFLLLILNFSVIKAVIAEEPDLLDLDLEALMNVEVYSVSKKAQKLSEAPSAVFVISSEDIRRSGATTVPELLRMVPGIEVARMNSNTWSVTSRGFNGRFANKLLVLIDGRSVYTPLFSGVYWQEQDLFLKDIDRIEVIRGPGATLWGANAVNGVINITTKDSSQTHGTYIYGGGGSEERANGGVRYGSKLGENGNIRVYAKYFNRDSSEEITGGDAFDQYDGVTTGVRTDFELSEKTKLTVQGDLFYSEQETALPIATLTPPFTEIATEEEDQHGYNVLSRVTHDLGNESELSAQFYYNRTSRDQIFGSFNVDTLDFDFQHRLPLFEGHVGTWGVNYRFISDDIDVGRTVSGVPIVDVTERNRDYSLISGFLHDEISLIDDELVFTLGSKFEHNDYSGFEVQPNARLMWTPAQRHSVWAAYSRSVRTPARINHDVIGFFGVTPLMTGGLGQSFVVGDRSFDSENLNAYELGYRAEPRKDLSIDIATFYFDYDDLASVETRSPVIDPSTVPPTVTIPLAFDNLQEAHTWGAEVLVEYRPTEWWRLQAAYAFLEMDVNNLPSSNADDASTVEKGNSHNKASIRSLIDVNDRLELDAFLRYVDNMPANAVSAYIELDLRVGYKISDEVAISIVGQNLLDGEHEEFGSTAFSPVVTNLERSVFGMVSWELP